MATQTSKSKRFGPSYTPSDKAAQNSGMFSDSGKGQKLDPNVAVKGGQELLEGAVAVTHKNARRQTITIKA